MASPDESQHAQPGGEPDGCRLTGPPNALSRTDGRHDLGERTRSTAGFFAPNLERRGRWVRAVWGLVTLGAGALLVGGEGWRFWVGLGLIALGLLGLVEAWRGWCLARACGLKTRF